VTVGTGAQADAFTVTYGADGYPASLLDPLGQVVASLQHDGAGRLTRKTVSDGGETLAGYDGNDNLAAVTPPGRPAHTLTHTPGDRLAGYAPPDVGAGNPGTAYAYGPDGELVTITRPDGQIVSIAYDPAGRPSTITSAAGPMTYVYNPASGQLATVTAPGGVTLAYTYDGALVTGETLAGPVSGTVARAHDADFRLLFETVAGTSFVSFGYDPDGLPLQAGALILRRHPQHGLVTGTTLGVVEDEWTHADDAEEASQRVTAQGVELYRVERVRDRRGRISQTTETIGGVTEVSDYAYDGVGRLTEVRRSGLPVATYAYDRNGNRLSVIRPSGTVTATYDAQDRLEQHGGVTYTYTRAGDLLTRTAGAQTTTYGYDAFGSLRHVTLADGRMLDYVIDGRGRRVGKRINGVLVQGFLYRDDLSPIAELDGAGALVSRFVYASERNVPDYLERGGQTYRIVSDPLGSPRLVVDATTGAIVQRLDYDEFGNVVLDTNPGFQPFGFAGGLYDRDTRLVRFGARDYDPETGRWTAKDPIGFDGGDTNLYAYALNDPLNLTDPSGRVAQIIIGVLVGGGVDLALQLAANGGNFDCVNWGEVALNAALGGATGGLNHLRTLRAAKQALTIEKELNAARRATRLAEMERNALKGIKAGDKVEVVKLPGQASTRPNIGNQTGRGTLGTNSQGGGASGSGRR
jgi:RHS repeat-associated protein